MVNYWQGKNVRLRAFEEKDIERMVEKRGEADAQTAWCYDKLAFPNSEADVKKFCTNLLAEQRTDDKYYFIIETLNEEFAGHVYVWYTEKVARVFRYGIEIEEKFRKKGYAAEVLVIAMDYYFNELNYQKCAPTVYEFNKRSQTFHEKFGFIKEGCLRNEIYSRGKHYGLIYYGMLKDEFNKLYKHNFLGENVKNG